MRALITYEPDRAGRDMVFKPDGVMFRTGAAGTRCFRDIADQLSPDAVLATAMRAVEVMPEVELRRRGYRKPVRKLGEVAVVVEALLVAGGLSVSKAYEISQDRYRNRRAASVELGPLGFAPPPSEG